MGGAHRHAIMTTTFASPHLRDLREVLHDAIQQTQDAIRRTRELIRHSDTLLAPDDEADASPAPAADPR